MLRVRFEPWSRVVSVPPDRNLLQAALLDRIPLRHDCGGRAACGTCRVEILDGRRRFPRPTEGEVRVLGRQALDRGWRLACQTRPRGDACVRAPDDLRGAVAPPGGGEGQPSRGEEEPDERE